MHSLLRPSFALFVVTFGVGVAFGIAGTSLDQARLVPQSAAARPEPPLSNRICNLSGCIQSHDVPTRHATALLQPVLLQHGSSRTRLGEVHPAECDLALVSFTLDGKHVMLALECHPIRAEHSGESDRH